MFETKKRKTWNPAEIYPDAFSKDAIEQLCKAIEAIIICYEYDAQWQYEEYIMVDRDYRPAEKDPELCCKDPLSVAVYDGMHTLKTFLKKLRKPS